MRTTKYIIIGLLVLVMVTVFSLRENTVHKAEENKSPVKQQDEKQKITEKVEIKKEIQKLKKDKEEVDTPKLSYIYSEDPIVESQIINVKYAACFSYFMFQNNPKLNMESLYRSKTQQDYFKKASANCEKLNKDHPEYLLNLNNKEKIDFMKGKTATSKVGQMLEFYKNPIDTMVSNQEVVALYERLGNEYPELMAYPFLATLQYEFDTIFPDLKKLLLTTNTQYVAKISSLSKMFLSCQPSNDCGMGSGTLMSLCITEPNFCVSSFDELFNDRLSQGVQADVLLVLPYFKRLYNVD